MVLAELVRQWLVRIYNFVIVLMDWVGSHVLRCGQFICTVYLRSDFELGTISPGNWVQLRFLSTW